MMDFIDAYIEGGWIKYALAFLCGAVFCRFVPDFYPAATIGIPVAAAILLLRASNEREWPFNLRVPESKKGDPESRPS